ncbi:hypothetical protein [Falsiroseomonas sp.]|uniref:hypothetical protein n=1 Tax=Falsiroseomonas sp. TaxID=2870721 RepID=UPI002736E651|nr:hypothetical protein [Falsiroseomonas sp.]MDP3417879.1 hypothetical protein [Falsiroseomonas sp.]
MSDKGMRVSAVGMAWYRAETFAEVRASMADAEKLPATFEKFLYAAMKGEEKLRRAGHAVIRVYLDMDEFPAFCRARGLNVDAKGRMEYAAHVAHQMVQANGGGNA